MLGGVLILIAAAVVNRYAVVCWNCKRSTPRKDAECVHCHAVLKHEGA